MATEWYCRIMGDEWGPMSAEELMAVARWGNLSRDDVVRAGSGETWVRAELVEGLFDSPPPAATIMPGRSASAAQRPAPAKRSVRSIAPTQYWIKTGPVRKSAAGPFSARIVRKFAEQGVLKPFHLVSDDRRNWVRAGQISGVAFGEATAKTEKVSVRSAVWIDQPLVSPDSQTAHVAYSGCG